MANDPAMFGSGFDRIPKDRYWTEHWVAAALLRRLPSEVLDAVWEPAAGRGDIVRVLMDHGADVFASDSDMSEFEIDHCQSAEHDFLTGSPAVPWVNHTPRVHISAIVTNPPYNRAQEFVEKALAHPVRITAMLMRAEWNHASGRTHLFTLMPYSFEIVLTDRPRWDWFFRDKSEASPRHNFSWFVWDKSHVGEPTQYFEGKR